MQPKLRNPAAWRRHFCAVAAPPVHVPSAELCFWVRCTRRRPGARLLLELVECPGPPNPLRTERRERTSGNCNAPLEHRTSTRMWPGHRIEPAASRQQIGQAHERRSRRTCASTSADFIRRDEALVRRRQRFVFEIPESRSRPGAGVGLDDVATSRIAQLVLAARAGRLRPGERTDRRPARTRRSISAPAARRRRDFIDRAGRGTARHVVQRDAFARVWRHRRSGSNEPESRRRAVNYRTRHPAPIRRGSRARPGGARP